MTCEKSCLSPNRQEKEVFQLYLLSVPSLLTSGPYLRTWNFISAQTTHKKLKRLLEFCFCRLSSPEALWRESPEKCCFLADCPSSYKQGDLCDKNKANYSCTVQDDRRINSPLVSYSFMKWSHQQWN